MRRGMMLTMGVNPPLDILFEDATLIVVNKPAGQLFQGYTQGLPQTLDAQVKDHISGARVVAAERPYLGIVHRLDRPVSGAVIFGKNSKFTGRLATQFQERSVTKHYTAVVAGILPEPSGAWRDELPADPDEDASILKTCELQVRVVERVEGCTWIDIVLGTGRRNQIRRQCALRGFPIVGDVKFGAQAPFPGCADTPEVFRPIALHAEVLRFAHPKTGEVMTCRAPQPSFWQELRKKVVSA